MNKQNDVLNSARQLGYAITESTEYQDLVKAEDSFQNDIKLNKTIKELEDTRNMYSSATNLEDHEVNMYKAQIRNLEEVLANSENMNSLKSAKAKYDKVFKNINNIISYVTDDESRVKSESGKKDCSSCSGCSK